MAGSTTGPRVGVLALQGDFREHLSVLTALGAQAVPVKRAEELHHIDGLVIPGGESTTMDKLVRAFDLYDPLRDLIANGLPVYGSCAGMIMLADEVLDGRPDQRSFGGIAMAVRRNAFGRQVDSFEAPVEIIGVEGEPVNAVFIRAPWVFGRSERWPARSSPLRHHSALWPRSGRRPRSASARNPG